MGTFSTTVQTAAGAITVKTPTNGEILTFMREFNAARDATMFLEDRGIGAAYTKELIGADFAQEFSRLYISIPGYRDTAAGEAWYQLCAELLAFTWASEEQVSA